MYKKITTLIITFFLSASFFNLFAEEPEEETKKDPYNSGTFSGLKFRSIGPGIASGRIVDLAVVPENNAIFYVAVASGGLWKTTNAGTDFKPIFDKYGSFSIGCVTIDPNNSNIIWVGTGENNSQRSVPYGDGIYRSDDGGKSFKNMGLKKSEHIGKIIVHPENSDIVYVAAQGPLWGPGGERGLYKTSDGGKTWNLILEISENTGVSDLVMDPRNPDVLYASSYQRRRHVWTLINGGPESAIYKSTNGGKDWDKLTNGLPKGDVGRIGLAISPVNPDIVYSLIEGDDSKEGFYRSTDRGASWEKRFKYQSSSAQYYQEIFCDPVNPDIVYSVDTYTKYTLDGGKTWSNLGLKERHVDDHALWIDPKNTDHLLIGGDGGLYETFDRGEIWRFFPNLPVTQFYRIGIDNTEPFYFVYGGTQDNATIGGPSRTLNETGLVNSDFFFTKGGDGFQSRVDPVNPDIVYSQAQYGSLVRFDKKSGEGTDIKPIEELGEELRWNWDSPLIISPHSPTRLYFAANKLFRSDDRGNSWKKVSGDLSRQIDRNTLEVMGKIWSPEAVAKNASTSLYGNIVSLTESPVKENLIYAGTDDGLIQVTDDGGAKWTKIEGIPGIPKLIYVADLLASQHNEKRVYAVYNNHKMADFKPYIFVSNDKGKTWNKIVGELPENLPVHCIVEDHINENLLFIGTEWGIYFTVDGGKKWIQLKSGIPNIAVRDIEIQKRENDLALASFGRGFYILDDYSPLRDFVKKETIEIEAHISPVRDALMYIPNNAFSRRNLGENFFRAENPDFGATISYYLKETIKTKKQIRIEEEKKLRKTGKTPPYPTIEQLRLEDNEEKPYLLFIIKDNKGNEVRRMEAPAKAGLGRITWDLCYSNTSPINSNTKINKFSGMPVIPGEYQVEMYKSVNGAITKLTEPVKIITKQLDNATLGAKDKVALSAFYSELQEIQRVAYGANNYFNELDERFKLIKKTLLITPGISNDVINYSYGVEDKIRNIKNIFLGDESISKRNENQTPSLYDRLGRMFYYTWRNSSMPSQTYIDNLAIAKGELQRTILLIKEIINTDIPVMEKELNRVNAPWTPGRLIEMK